MAADNYPLAADAIFHSDRGSNYASRQFAGTLKKHNLRQSAGRTGICYDNAMAQCRLVKILSFEFPHIHR
jgi:putative transposase